MQPVPTPIEARFKEILYRFLEEVQATRAALYLFDEGRYRLLTSYGFRTPPPDIETSDAILAEFRFKRAPFFVNHPDEDRRLSSRMAQAGSTHMMILPLYAQARLVGLVDLRDKTGNKLFTDGDAEASRKILDEFASLFQQWGMYEAESAAASPQEAQLPKTPAGRLIEEAKAAMAGGALVQQPEPVTKAHLFGASAVLPGILAVPGVTLAAVSVATATGGMRLVSARSSVMPDALTAFENRIDEWLKKNGVLAPALSSTVTQPLGSSAEPVFRTQVGSVLTAPLRSRSSATIALSVAFETKPNADVRLLLESSLARAQQLLDLAASEPRLFELRRKVAQRLLEPDFQRYPALAAHSDRVAALAERLAKMLELPATDIESVALSALLHDVGMRLLDYLSLYGKPTVSPDEMNVLREHPVVGAAVVAQSGLGSDIAMNILHHHERADGKGYPKRIPANEIPIASRIIHICEAFDAMTGENPYRTPLPVRSALDRIGREAGAQFDPEIAGRFIQMTGH